jgi:hypothetical protein
LTTERERRWNSRPKLNSITAEEEERMIHPWDANFKRQPNLKAHGPSWNASPHQLQELAAHLLKFCFFSRKKNLLNLVFLKEKNLLNLSAALFACAYSELLSSHGTVFSSYNISA